MSNKGEQIALDLEPKIAIINDIEAGEKQVAAAAACNLAKPTVNSIWLNRSLFYRLSDNTDIG